MTAIGLLEKLAARRSRAKSNMSVGGMPRFEDGSMPKLDRTDSLASWLDVSNQVSNGRGRFERVLDSVSLPPKQSFLFMMLS